MKNKIFNKKKNDLSRQMIQKGFISIVKDIFLNILPYPCFEKDESEQLKKNEN